MISTPPAPSFTGIEREPCDPSPTELGRRIKMLRIAAGLTLKDLEKRGGISATHVSEIERGKASPTIGALARIAFALGVRPSTLIEPRLLADVTVLDPASRAARRVQEGLATIEPLTEPVHGAELSAALMTLPIAREPALSHHHEGEEIVTVLSGIVQILIDGHSHVLRE